MADFIAETRPVGRTVLTRTGGSTGEPVVHLKSWTDEQAAGKALERRLLCELGLSPGDEIVDLAPRLIFSRSDVRLIEPLCTEEPDGVLRWRLLSFRRRPSIEPLEEYCAVFARRIAFIDGAPSRIETLVDFCERSGYRLTPKAVVSSFEQLLPAQRDSFARTFGCPVVSLYGTTETGICGWECSQRRIHFERDFVWPEVLRFNEDTPAEPGEIGRIVVTSLSSWLMPIIRYETGDLGSLDGGSCICGRHDIALSTFEGRLGIVFQDALGTVVRPFFFMHRLDLSGVSHYQIVQVGPGVLEINIGASDLGDESLARLQRELETAGPIFSVSFVRKKPFLLTSSGKRNPFVVIS